MASVFKQQYYVTGPDGKRRKKKSRKWYIEYKDETGNRKRVPGFTDKQASEQKAAQLERTVERKESGLVDRFGPYRTLPISEHLEAFRESLADTTSKHVSMTMNALYQICVGCDYQRWADIDADPERVRIFLNQAVVPPKSKEGSPKRAEYKPKKISNRAFNFKLGAFKQFCKWMVLSRRAPNNPVEYLQRKNLRVDKQHERRPLEIEEVKRLVKATGKGKERFGMEGHERALLYQFAIETGLRANEIRTLKVSSFDMDNGTVTVEATYSKHRETDVLLLTSDMVAKLRDHMAGKLPGVKVFGGTYKALTDKTSDMIQADLAATEETDDAGNVIVKGIPYVDDTGRFADFHSLRHTTSSWLQACGVHPTVIQKIMRHSDPRITLGVYTHPLSGQVREALDRLPNLSQSDRVAQAG